MAERRSDPRSEADEAVPWRTRDPPIARRLVVVRDLLFAQYKKGVSSLPLAGGAAKLVLKTGAPSSVLALPGALFVTDKSYGRCTQTDEGQACAFDGSAFRVKY